MGSELSQNQLIDNRIYSLKKATKLYNQLIVEMLAALNHHKCDFATKFEKRATTIKGLI